MNEEKIIAALTLIPACPLEVSLRTGLPWQDARADLERLSQQGKIQRYTRWKNPTYAMLNPRVRLKDVM